MELGSNDIIGEGDNMTVELDDLIYDANIELIQLEIIGRCNMRCKHCRAANQPKDIINKSQMIKIIDFIKKVKSDDFRMNISGGEPFLHPKLLYFLELAKKNNIDKFVITTNASLIDKDVLDKLDKLNLSYLCLQVSIDSLNKDVHNKFRGYPGAFEKCEEVLEQIKKYKNINSSIRMTITNDTIDEIDDMILFAIDKGCKIVSFGSVIPFGNASDCKLSFFDESKEKFIKKIMEKKKEYEGRIKVATEDPLQNLYDYENNSLDLDFDITDNCIFGGCSAGTSSLNINSDGTITPCSMMNEKILNINDYDNVFDIIKEYESSPVIKKLFSRKYSGKCGKCQLSRICGGCRAVAKALTGDYMGPDLSCWRKI